MQVFITTSDDYVYLTRGFAHQWNKYCGLPVTLVWRNVQPPMLPNNFMLQCSPARYFDWSGSLANALERSTERIILLGLEDFWISDQVNMTAFYNAVMYMEDNPEIKRIDLTEDRTAYPHTERDDYVQAIIDPDKIQYVLSTQFSLWDREYLIHALRLGDSVIPPQFEVELSRIAARENPVILGTKFKVIPCHGDGVIWNGKLNNLHLEYLKPDDVQQLKDLGYV